MVWFVEQSNAELFIDACEYDPVKTWKYIDGSDSFGFGSSGEFVKYKSRQLGIKPSPLCDGRPRVGESECDDGLGNCM